MKLAFYVTCDSEFQSEKPFCTLFGSLSTIGYDY